MRLLHVADSHLGLLTHSRPDPGTGLPSRLLDVARCWRFACRTAVEREVDVLVHAGDAFHVRDPDAVSLNLFEEGLRELEESEIPAVLIAGNHDRGLPGRSSIVELFHDPPRVRAIARPEIVDAGGIRVACLPSVSRHQLMAANPEHTRASADVALFDALKRVLDMLRAQGADVLTGHWSVEGAVLGSEAGLDLSITGEPALPPSSLEGPWSFVAFGHIHRQQAIRIGSFEIGGYAGSIDRMNFGEEDYSPSVTLVDLEQHEAELIPTPARRFLTIEGHPNGGTFPHVSVEDAIVRVRFQVTQDEASRIDRDQLQRLLLGNGAHQVRIELDVARERRMRAEHIAEAAGPLEQLEQWFDATGIPEEERADLRLAAKELAS